MLVGKEGGTRPVKLRVLPLFPLEELLQALYYLVASKRLLLLLLQLQELQLQEHYLSVLVIRLLILNFAVELIVLTVDLPLKVTSILQLMRHFKRQKYQYLSLREICILFLILVDHQQH